MIPNRTAVEPSPAHCEEQSMIGFPIALLVANGFEWYAHKYILHGVRGRGSRATARAPPT